MPGKNSKRKNRPLAGWMFLAVVVIVYGVTAIFDNDLAATALAGWFGLLARVIPVLALIFGLLFLAEMFLERAWIVRHLTRAAGPKGWALAVLCGVLSVGPIYAWYPLLGELSKKGMRRALAATFLYSRALKLPLLPLMAHYFGVAYTIFVSISFILFAVLNGLIMEAIMGDRPSHRPEDVDQ